MQEPRLGTVHLRRPPRSLQSCLALDEFVGEMLQLIEIIKQLSFDVLNVFCDKIFIADGNGDCFAKLVWGAQKYNQPVRGLLLWVLDPQACDEEVL